LFRQRSRLSWFEEDDHLPCSCHKRPVSAGLNSWKYWSCHKPNIRSPDNASCDVRKTGSFLLQRWMKKQRCFAERLNFSRRDACVDDPISQSGSEDSGVPGSDNRQSTESVDSFLENSVWDPL
jgi:hypothetical protein